MHIKTQAILFVLLWMMVPAGVFAQLGQFDDLELDGNGSNPFIRFEQPNGDQDFLVAFTERMSFYVSNGYKFTIFEDAQNDALVLDGSGVSIKRALNVDMGNSDDLVRADHATTGQRFSVVSLDAMTGLHGGGIGFATNSSSFPFYVFDTARSESLSVRQQGVGVGTYDAEAPLHVYSEDFSTFPAASILVENNVGTTAIREMFSLVNNGGSRFSFTDTDRDSKWSFASDTAGRFSISVNDSGGPEFIIQSSGRVLMGPGPNVNFDLRPSGNLFLTGTLFQSSDKNLKTAFNEVVACDVLAKIADMPIQSWQFKADDPSQRHIGPTSQDFQTAFNLGPDDKTIAPIDGIGVSLVAIKALHKQLGQKNEEVAQLADQVSSQQKRLDHQQRLLERLSKRLDDLQEKNRDLVMH